jgi:hypothetical protein
MKLIYVFIVMIVVVTLNNIITEWLGDEDNILQLKHFAKKNNMENVNIVSTALAVMEWKQCFSSGFLTILGVSLQAVTVKLISNLK